MLLPTVIGAAGLLVTAVEAAPRGTWFNKFQRDDAGWRPFKERVARSDSQSPDYQDSQPGVNSPDTYTKAGSQYAAPKNSSVNSKTLDQTTECPTGGVHVSTTTLDMTITVTASSNMSYTICRDCTQTLTRDGTVYLPPSKYVSTLSYDAETKAVYPLPETTNGGEQKNSYLPINATYLPPKTKVAHDPEETEPCTDDDHPYMNSTLAAPRYTKPVGGHSGYQSAIYNTPSGYKSDDAPVYTRPAYIKPVYPEPNSSVVTPVYTKPAYTKPVYPHPSASGSSTIVPPVYTKPVYPHPSGNSSTPPAYTKPAYTKPVYPDPSGNSSTVVPVYTPPVDRAVYTPPVYGKPSYSADPLIPGNSTATPPVYTKPVVPSAYTPPPVYTKPTYPQTPVSGNSSTVPTESADPSVYTPPVYTKPVYPHPVTSGNSSTSKGAIYTPPVNVKPVYSEPGNSSTVSPVFTTPVDPPAYTLPAYTKPIVPGNSSTREDPVYTPPVNTKPVYPGPLVSSSSADPVYTPPVNTRPAYPDPAASGNSSTTPLPVYTKPIETPVYSKPASSKPVETPVYSPPVYVKPVFPSESSDAYPLPSPPSNSTIPAVLPASSSDASIDPTFTPEASTSQSDLTTTSNPVSSSTELTTLPVTPFLTTTTSFETSTTEPCIIDTSMLPISSSYLNTTATTPSVPTETICEDDAENGAPKANTAYCGVKGQALGRNFLAEFGEDSYGMPVTLEGCYQFCKLDLPSTRGCEAYRFYHNASGAPRCAVYGLSVYRDIRELDSTVEDVWYDLSCGSPSQYRDGSKSSGIGASIKLGLGLNY